MKKLSVLLLALMISMLSVPSFALDEIDDIFGLNNLNSDSDYDQARPVGHRHIRVKAKDRIIPPNSPMPCPPVQGPVQTQDLDNEVPTVTPVAPAAPSSPAAPAVWGRSSFKSKPRRSIFAVGFYGDLPTLTISPRPENEITLGLTACNGDLRAVIRGAGSLYQSADPLTTVKAGLSVFPGDVPAWGVFVGFEQKIAENLRLFADLYPVMAGGQTVIGRVIYGGRIDL
ncbi:MAG: hypothetical protein WC529_08930 [Candidatus Margulisiibacteriota bacterium]